MVLVDQIWHNSNVIHYLDDFFYLLQEELGESQSLLTQLFELTAELGVPLAAKKTLKALLSWAQN